VDFATTNAFALRLRADDRTLTAEDTATVQVSMSMVLQ